MKTFRVHRNLYAAVLRNNVGSATGVSSCRRRARALARENLRQLSPLPW